MDPKGRIEEGLLAISGSFLRIPHPPKHHDRRPRKAWCRQMLFITPDATHCSSPTSNVQLVLVETSCSRHKPLLLPQILPIGGRSPTPTPTCHRDRSSACRARGPSSVDREIVEVVAMRNASTVGTSRSRESLSTSLGRAITPAPPSDEQLVPLTVARLACPCSSTAHDAHGSRRAPHSSGACRSVRGISRRLSISRASHRRSPWPLWIPRSHAMDAGRCESVLVCGPYRTCAA
ncbi:hypothetical protein B0H13DRAFT_754491 [Mycena leptocephala]|nr:hypothetical protein B0H13DRAFT_754491 [Mycena leptocephala]